MNHSTWTEAIRKQTTSEGGNLDKIKADFKQLGGYGAPAKGYVYDKPYLSYIGKSNHTEGLGYDEAPQTFNELPEDTAPVIEVNYRGVNVSGYQVVAYPEGFLHHYFADLMTERLDRKRIPDELEHLYPTVMNPLELAPRHQDWVWDAVNQVFPRYAEIHRPKAITRSPYVNVGTLGHVDHRPNAWMCRDRANPLPRNWATDEWLTYVKGL